VQREGHSAPEGAILVSLDAAMNGRSSTGRILQGQMKDRNLRRIKLGIMVVSDDAFRAGDQRGRAAL
jgi:hypothetical protein